MTESRMVEDRIVPPCILLHKLAMRQIMTSDESTGGHLFVDA